MTAILLDGKTLAETQKAGLKKQIDALLAAGKPAPCLAVVLVGEDPASRIYVSNKRKACEAVGFRSLAFDLPASLPEAELLDLITALNQDQQVQGILIQLPLPSHMDSNKVIESMDPSKDVDGFHPYNIGRLAQGNPGLRPCTPFGIMQLLQQYQIPLQGIEALVIGASNIVGRPMVFELIHAKASVSVCQSSCQDLEGYVRRSQLLVVATGVADLVKTEWLNREHIVVDVGIHRLANGRIRGDIDFEAAKERVRYLSPTPGGVGPMTVSCLLQNCWQAYQKQAALI